MTDATELLSNILHKPSRYIMVILETNTNMMFAENIAPLAYVELNSIGLQEDDTALISGKLCEFIEGELKVPQDRTYIEFTDAKRNMFGWNRGIF